MPLLQIITPFLYSSYGALYSEHSGTTNVTIEGYISLGGFLFIIITKSGLPPIPSFILSVTLVGIFALFQSLLTYKLKANDIITGIAANMGIGGLISVVSFKLFNTKGVLPLETRDEFYTLPIMITALIIPIITYLVLSHSVYGLRLKALGINRKSLTYAGINTLYYKVSATTITGVMAAIAGVFLAMELRSFTPNLAGGRGWISLVIVFLGRKRTFGLLISCLIFGLTLMISNSGQNWIIPSELVLAIPYALTLIALIFTNPILNLVGKNKKSRKEE